MTGSDVRRIVGIVIGEAAWSVLDDPDIAPALPFLARLRAEGASGTTVAPQPLDTYPLWAAVITGRTAEGHGIFGPVRPTGSKSFRSTGTHDLQCPAIWHLVEAAGMPAGGFGVHLANPEEPVSGFTIGRAGRQQIHPSLTQPPELYEYLTQRHGEFTMKTMARTRDEWTSRTPTDVETRTDALIDLLGVRPWRFALVDYQDATDAQHLYLGDDRALVGSVYAAVDRAIERVVEAVGPDTVVFVFSECGAGSIRHGICINNWLEQQGLLRRGVGLKQRLGGPFAHAVAAFRRFLPRARRGRKGSMLRQRIHNSLSASTLDWARSRAFALGDSSQIYLNVPDAHRAALADDLRDRLLDLRDPEGRRVVEDVVALTDSPDDAPDLTIVWEDDAYVPVEGLEASGGVFVEWWSDRFHKAYTGAHRREGVLLVGGPGVGKTDLGHVSTLDLVPTWLDLLGIAKPEELDGVSFADKLET